MSERNDRFEAMLPCPFCGGDAIRGVSGGGVFMVSCGNKECKADVSVPQSIWGEDGQPQDVSWEEMISAWNQRAATALAEAEAEITRLRAALISWRNGFEAGRNEPLRIAYEIGNEALGVPAEQSKREAAAMSCPHATKGEAG